MKRLLKKNSSSSSLTVERGKINIETHRSTALKQCVILVQRPWRCSLYRSNFFICIPEGKINIETRRSTTLKQRVILVQGPC